MVLNRRIPTLLTRHPSVLDVCLVGSRAEGRANERSDWDFLIKTSDFGAVAKALPELLAPLECLAQQWDPLRPPLGVDAHAAWAGQGRHGSGG